LKIESQVRLLLDAGGQGCRAMAVDDRGRVIARYCVDVHTSIHGDRVEQDGEELANAMEQVALDVGGRIKDADLVIREAALAVQRGSVVCWHRHTGQPLSPVLSWRDRRGSTEGQQEEKVANKVKQRTGLRFSPYGGGSKLAWCLDNLPEVQAAAKVGDLAFGPLGSFLVARLVEGHPCLVDDTLAQRTLLWSRHSLNWDPWLLDLAGLPDSGLPQVMPSRSEFGRLKSVPENPSLNLVLGDQNAVPFITGKPRTDTLYINLGTSAFLLRPIDQVVNTPFFQLSLLDRQPAGKGTFALEASIHGAASAIAWYETRLGRKIHPDEFDGLREKIDHPPLFINSVDGLGSPWWTPGPDPEFVDETGDQAGSTGSRLLAILESIAFLVRVNFEELNRLTGPADQIVVTGGLSCNDTLCELLASIMDRELLRPEITEGTAMGLWGRITARDRMGHAVTPVHGSRQAGLFGRYAKWLDCIRPPGQ